MKVHASTMLRTYNNLNYKWSLTDYYVFEIKIIHNIVQEQHQLKCEFASIYNNTNQRFVGFCLVSFQSKVES